MATIGRWATWLPDWCKGRDIWLAFDASKGADVEAARYRVTLSGAKVRRIRPPGRSKDWNSALRKQGVVALQYWLKAHLTAAD